jgi:hypothetical protein
LIEPRLFIADKENGCVWVIELKNKIVSTYSGKCKDKGLQDGPYNLNRFNAPDSIGIDVQGNLMVYDSTDNLVRFIDSITQILTTLVNGVLYFLIF